MREGIREKTELAVRKGASRPPSLKPPTTVEQKQAQMDEWLAWVEADEDELCQYLDRRPTDEDEAEWE